MDNFYNHWHIIFVYIEYFLKKAYKFLLFINRKLFVFLIYNEFNEFKYIFKKIFK